MNLVFIALDTLRADHLSCYGYPKQTSPNIDTIAACGARFENFYSVGNCTHPGFTAMLSGRHPESTGIVNHWTKIDPPSDTLMMAERFSRAGYQTAAIDNLFDGWVPSGHREYPWFRRGYDHYEYPQKPGFYQASADCVSMACNWLEQQAQSPFMLFLHIWNPHAPYNKAPEEFYRFYNGSDPCSPDLDYMPPHVRQSQQRTFGKPITDPGYVVAAYDAEIAYTDHTLGTLFEKLENLKLRDDTVILITSDHGEIMAQPRLAQGWPWCFCHIGLNEDNLRLPLIIAGGPVAEGTRPAGLTQLIDIVPTLTEMFGLEQDQDFDGLSLMPALSSSLSLRAEGGGEEFSGHGAVFVSENTYQKQRAAVRGPWKYMRLEEETEAMPPRSLFNLESDPEELVNLVAALPDRAAEMDELLNAHIAKVIGPHPDPLLGQPVTSRPEPPT